jgi:hypothetical protein
MDIISNIQEISGLIRDIGLIFGVPSIFLIILKLYNQYVLTLKEQNAFLKETQYDKALQLIQSEKKLHEIEMSKLEIRIKELKSNLLEKDQIINDNLENDKIRRIKNNENTLLIKERLKQVRIEEINLDKKKKIIEDLNIIYNNLFSDLVFVADFKSKFFEKDNFSYYHYGGLNESVSFYLEFAGRLEKLELATYEEYCDEIESGVSITLTEKGIKFKELLFNK